MLPKRQFQGPKLLTLRLFGCAARILLPGMAFYTLPTSDVETMDTMHETQRMVESFCLICPSLDNLETANMKN